jgi:hypothetical protein
MLPKAQHVIQWSRTSSLKVEKPTLRETSVECEILRFSIWLLEEDRWSFWLPRTRFDSPSVERCLVNIEYFTLFHLCLSYCSAVFQSSLFRIMLSFIGSSFFKICLSVGNPLPSIIIPQRARMYVDPKLKSYHSASLFQAHWSLLSEDIDISDVVNYLWRKFGFFPSVIILPPASIIKESLHKHSYSRGFNAKAVCYIWVCVKALAKFKNWPKP